MQKRGDFSSNFLFYFVAVVVLILMFYFGLTSLGEIKSKGCGAETTLLVQRLQADAEEISYEQGSVVDKEYSISCGVDKVYFVDQNIDVLNPQQLQIIEPFPVIVEEISSATGKNVFFYQDSSVEDSAEVTNLNLGFPFYRCLKVRSGKIKVRFTGNGAAVNVTPLDESFDCDPTITVIESGLDEDILAEALGINKNVEIDAGDVFGSGVLPDGDEVSPAILAERTFPETVVTQTQDLTITRVIEEVPGESKTVVNLLVERRETAKKKFFYIERIPKRCLEEGSLDNGVLSDVRIGEDGKVKVREDPLIVWVFPPDVDPTIGYTLNTLLDESCKEDIGGSSFRFRKPLSG
tara:strand:+ start:96 stop:1145 length:1050 start_codon:yes stop_codon:yes gene_type:complete